jgi:hypothetical protein
LIYEALGAVVLLHPVLVPGHRALEILRSQALGSLDVLMELARAF